MVAKFSLLRLLVWRSAKYLTMFRGCIKKVACDLLSYIMSIFENQNLRPWQVASSAFIASTHQLRIPRHRLCCVRSGRTGWYVVATSTVRRLVTGGDLWSCMRHNNMAEICRTCAHSTYGKYWQREVNKYTKLHFISFDHRCRHYFTMI